MRPAPAGGVAFSVADTGRGMDSVQLADIFQPFKRLGAQTSGTEGSGMSLFVSRRVVEPMGGSSIVDSGPGAGTGTVFTVSLPAAPGR